MTELQYARLIETGYTVYDEYGRPLGATEAKKDLLSALGLGDE